MLKYYNVMNSQNNDDGKFHHFESASMFHQFLSNISFLKTGVPSRYMEI